MENKMQMQKDLEALLKQRTAIDQQIEEMRKGARVEAISAAKKLIAEHDLSAQELFGGRKGKRKVASPKPKYRNPETGETWSGRGQTPRWLRALEEKGLKRDSYSV